MTQSERPFPPIGEIFYRTRALKGREWTLKRFAGELGIDPVFLGYIEKGQRFPNEELVGKVARMRGEDPRELLAVLYRDRMVHVLTREIRRAIGGADEAAESEAVEPEHKAHDFFVDRYDSVRRRAAAAVRAEIDAGHWSSDIDPDRLAVILIALADGLQLQWLLDDSVDMADHLSYLIDLIGIRT